MTLPGDSARCSRWPRADTPASVICQPLRSRMAKPSSVSSRASAMAIQPTRSPAFLRARLRRASNWASVRVKLAVPERRGAGAAMQPLQLLLQPGDLAAQIGDVALQLGHPQLEIIVLALDLQRMGLVHDLYFLVPFSARMSRTRPVGPAPVDLASLSPALAREVGRINFDMMGFRTGP